MASNKTTTSVALFFCLNLLFFSLVTACGPSCSNNPYPRRPRPPGRIPGNGGNPPSTGPGNGGGPPSTGPGNGGGPPSTGPGNGGGPPSTGPGNGGGPPSTGPGGSCPRDALKIAACANVLGGLVNVTIGNPPVTPCCQLIQGLVDLEAAVCLCTVIRANILGINLNLPVSLSLLLNVCSRNVPRGFQCA